MPRFVYPVMILSSRSWEIGSPPIGSAGKMNLSCVMPASVIHI